MADGQCPYCGGDVEAPSGDDRLCTMAVPIWWNTELSAVVRVLHADYQALLRTYAQTQRELKRACTENAALRAIIRQAVVQADEVASGRSRAPVTAWICETRGTPPAPVAMREV